MNIFLNSDLIVLGSTISAIGILGFVVLFQDHRSMTARSFFVFSLISILWGVLNYASYQVVTENVSLWLWRFVIFTAVWFCFCIFHVSYVFPEKEVSFPKWYKFILIPGVIVSSLLTLTPFVFAKLASVPVQGQVPVIEPGIGIPIFGFTVIYLVSAAIYEFLRKRKRKETQLNQQILLIMCGTAITFALLILCNFILPVGFGIYIFIPFGAVFIFPFIACVAYAILHYHLFNVRIITTEIFAFALTIVTLLQIVFSSSAPELIFRIAIFILVLVIAILLIKSVLVEVQQREEIQQLATQLELANEQQVTLIHFITHQIKGFLTKSRNIFSMTLEGEFGVVPETLKPMLEEGLRSDTQGVTTVQEILNASNIRSGKVTYNMQPFDFAELVKSIVTGLKPSADKKQLALNLMVTHDSYMIVGDRMQLENAVKNIIDNSIKYTPSGEVNVSLSKEGSVVRFVEQDTGVGITAEDMSKLFTEGGHGKESIKVNVESTGFGLYIVKNIITAHGGKIWAESEGAGKGSKFIIELPVGKVAPEQSTQAQPAAK